MNRQMTDDQLDRALSQFLAARHEEIVTAAFAPQQAAALVRDRAVPRVAFVARPSLAVMLALALLLAALLVAAIAGAALLRRPAPVPGNGLITFGLGELTQRPYDVVHVVRPDGTGDRAIGPGVGQTFSADGRVLAYWAGPYPDQVLTVAGADGSSSHAIRGIVGGGDFALSPDGTRIAWSKTVGTHTFTGTDGSSSGWAVTELWVSPLTGAGGVRIAGADLAPDGFVSNPVWSPDGSSIAFAINTLVADGANSGFYRSAVDVVAAEGSGGRRLTDRPGSDSVGISWSPDGQYVAYTAFPNGTPLPSFPPTGQDPNDFFRPDDIFVIAADGTGERDVTNTPDHEVDPAWSPDGSHLAWVTAGEQRLTILRLDRSNPMGGPVRGPLLQGDYVWSPDSSRICFYWYEPPADGIAGGQAIDVTIEFVPVADPQASPSPILAVQRMVRGLAWQRLEPGALGGTAK
jgi:WD40-like Beta Propeller Repeat